MRAITSGAPPAGDDQLDWRCGVALGDRGGAPTACQGKDAREQRDELAPSHSITSSAVASKDAGMVRPSILAVEALMTNSNLLDCTTGKSAGFAPLRMRPV